MSDGGSVVDPRTGEIIKGHVSLGSLRIRQDFMIAQGLLSSMDENARTEKMQQMAFGAFQDATHPYRYSLSYFVLSLSTACSVSSSRSVLHYYHRDIRCNIAFIFLY